jgi:hypothetical protein
MHGTSKGHQDSDMSSPPLTEPPPHYLQTEQPELWARAQKIVDAELDRDLKQWEARHKANIMTRGRDEAYWKHRLDVIHDPAKRRKIVEHKVLEWLAGETEKSNVTKAKDTLTSHTVSGPNKGRKPTRKPMQFDYKLPETEAELDAIQERIAELARVAHTIASLGVAGVDAAPVQVAGLHEISTRTERLAREIGLHAIAEGKMSQVQVGRALGVNQATVSRMVKEAQEQQD